MIRAQPSPRTELILEAVGEFAAATSNAATAQLLEPLTFLLAQVRKSLSMDVVFVSRFTDAERVFEVVSAEGEDKGLIHSGASDPLLDTYCQRVVEGRLPTIIPDTAANLEAASLPITPTLKIGAYLSAPVLLANGKAFGTVCCISHATRPDLQQADADALRAVAQAVAACVGPSGRVRFASWTHSGGGI